MSPDNFLCQYFRMELLHCEKLRKQKSELEKAEMDLVSVANSGKYTDFLKSGHAYTDTLVLYSVLNTQLFTASRVNMNFLKRSLAANWLMLCTEMLRKKSKVGFFYVDNQFC